MSYRDIPVPYNCYICQRIQAREEARKSWSRTKPFTLEDFEFDAWVLHKVDDNMRRIVLRYWPPKYKPGHTDRFRLCPEHYEPFKALIKQHTAERGWKELLKEDK